MEYSQYQYIWDSFRDAFVNTKSIPKSVSLQEDNEDFVGNFVILDCDEAEHTTVPCNIWKRNGYDSSKALPINAYDIYDPDVILKNTGIMNASFCQELVYQIDNTMNIASIVEYIYNDWLKLQTFKEFMSGRYLTDIYTLKIVLIAESFDGLENANVDHNIVSQWVKVRFDDIVPNWDNSSILPSLDKTLSLLEKVGDFGNIANDHVSLNYENYRDMIVAFNTKFPKFEAKNIIPLHPEEEITRHAIQMHDKFFKENEQIMLSERARIMKHPRFLDNVLAKSK